jgi:hypothetical protein
MIFLTIKHEQYEIEEKYQINEEQLVWLLTGLEHFGYKEEPKKLLRKVQLDKLTKEQCFEA